MLVAYLRTFQRMGMQAVPMKAASGPIGGDLSHEFLVLRRPARARCSTMPRSRRSTGAQSDIDYGDERGLHRCSGA